jgi:hypothetical protein
MMMRADASERVFRSCCRLFPACAAIKTRFHEGFILASVFALGTSPFDRERTFRRWELMHVSASRGVPERAGAEPERL